MESKLEHKREIYPLLFKIYLYNHNLDGADKILTGFNKTFPSQTKTTEALLASLMDHQIIKTSKEHFLRWVQRINSKEFKVSKKLAHSIRINALNIQ